MRILDRQFKYELYIESIDFNTDEVEISYNGVLESPNPTTLNGLSSKLSFSTPLKTRPSRWDQFHMDSYSNKVVI